MDAEERRIMEYNQRAGELFDDWWMFGERPDEQERWFSRVVV